MDDAYPMTRNDSENKGTRPHYIDGSLSVKISHQHFLPTTTSPFLRLSLVEDSILKTEQCFSSNATKIVEPEDSRTACVFAEPGSQPYKCFPHCIDSTAGATSTKHIIISSNTRIPYCYENFQFGGGFGICGWLI